MKITEELMKEMEKGMEKLELEFQQKEQQKIDDIKNGRLQRVMENIYLHLKKEQVLDKDDITYSPEKFLISGDDFDFVFDLLRFYAAEMDFIGQEEPEDEEAICFEHEIGWITYKDLHILFKIVWGQGAACWFEVADEKTWNENLSFSFQDFADEILDFTSDEETPEKQQRTFSREMRKTRSRVSEILQEFQSVIPAELPTSLQAKQKEAEKLFYQLNQVLMELANKDNWN
jgi:hypothetical protein